MADFIIKNFWDGTPAPDSESTRVSIASGNRESATAGITIQIDAPFFGDPEPAGPPGIYDGLWEHEVCEVFLVGADGRYLELEFGPHGHYLALLLDRPRHIISRDHQLHYQSQCHGDRWSAEARAPTALLPELIDRVNLFAIHGTGPDRRYLAWSAVPGSQPDFHQPESFPRWPTPQST